MNKRGELTDMKREWEASGREGRLGERNNSSFLVIRDYRMERLGGSAPPGELPGV